MEDEAWRRMQENKKEFYAYARKKKRVRPYIGPFTRKGKVVRKKACEVLSEEFYKAYRAPAEGENEEVDDGYFSSEEDLMEGKAKLKKVIVTVEEVMEELMKMTSEASGPTGVTPYVTRKLGRALVPYLTIYYNGMSEEEDVPGVNRLSYVAPLLKPGKKPEDPASYRPVSLTEVWIRLYERVLKRHIVAHLEEIDFISRYQHGFVPGKSTFTNLLENQERILEALEEGAPMGHSIYLDLKRAFDRCPFKLLIIRLKKAGITGKLLKYIYNFLRNRTFRVIANGSISEGRLVLSSTPQGSGLSPVIFAIFIQSLAEKLDIWIKELEEMESA